MPRKKSPKRHLDTELPAALVTQLADKHEINLDASFLFGLDFLQAMNWQSFRYGVMSNLKYDTGKVKEQTKILVDRAKQLVKAIDNFDEALLGFTDLSVNPSDKKMPILRRNVERQQKQVRVNAKLWVDAASRAYAEFEAQGPLKANVGNPAFTFMLKDLIQIYEEGKGKKAGVSINDDTKEYGDPRSSPMNEHWRKAKHRQKREKLNKSKMTLFIKDCLNILSAEKKTKKALERAIDKQLSIKKALSE